MTGIHSVSIVVIHFWIPGISFSFQLRIIESMMTYFASSILLLKRILSIGIPFGKWMVGCSLTAIEI